MLHLEVDDHQEDGHSGQQLNDVGQSLAVEGVLLNRNPAQWKDTINGQGGQG